MSAKDVTLAQLTARAVLAQWPRCPKCGRLATCLRALSTAGPMCDEHGGNIPLTGWSEIAQLAAALGEEYRR